MSTTNAYAAHLEGDPTGLHQNPSLPHTRDTGSQLQGMAEVQTKLIWDRILFSPGPSLFAQDKGLLS